VKIYAREEKFIIFLIILRGGRRKKKLSAEMPSGDKAAHQKES
jgi:hypothetical protein